MGKIIDLTKEKQKSQPISNMFDESMGLYTDDDFIKASVDDITGEICETFGAGQDSPMHYIILGFVMACVYTAAT